MRVNEKRASTVDGPLCRVPCFKADLVARLRTGLPKKPDIERARALFAALADGHRLRIVSALAGGDELCVCDVAHVLGVGVSVASHHLRRLRDMGLLRDRDDGKMVYYALQGGAVTDIVRRAVGARTA